MSKSKSRVFTFDSGDPAIQQANANARATFGFFWRELAWERRRIIPGLSIAAVKAAFSDGPGVRGDDGQSAEQMWVGEVDFDGKHIRGELLNAPNWLESVKQGDQVSLELAEISDWMYSFGEEVFGAFTVNLMRSRMSKKERKQHDDAWGLDFGDPDTIRLAPDVDFGDKPQMDGHEHPMSENVGESFREQVEQDPSIVTSVDDRGWTLLHHQALAGSIATVKVLLEAGADRNAVTGHGMTAAQLAKSLGWSRVAALIARPS